MLLSEDLNHLGRRNLNRDQRDALIKRLAASGVRQKEKAEKVGLDRSVVTKIISRDVQNAQAPPFTTPDLTVTAKLKDEIDALRRLAEAIPLTLPSIGGPPSTTAYTDLPPQDSTDTLPRPNTRSQGILGASTGTWHGLFTLACTATPKGSHRVPVKRDSRQGECPGEGMQVGGPGRGTCRWVKGTLAGPSAWRHENGRGGSFYRRQ